MNKNLTRMSILGFISIITVTLFTTGTLATAISNGPFGPFFRTIGATFTPANNVNSFLYGYGYTGSGSWGYGYGYGFNNDYLNASTSSNTSGGGGGGGAPLPSSANSAQSVNITTGVNPSTSTGLIITTNTGLNATVAIYNEPKICGREVIQLSEADVTTTLKIATLENRNRNSDITRAEFIYLLIKNSGVVITPVNTAPFADVRATSKYAAAISYAKTIGLINPVTNFRPFDTLTRSEMAKITVRSFGGVERDTRSFVEANNSLSGYAEAAYKLCILHGRRVIN